MIATDLQKEKVTDCVQSKLVSPVTQFCMSALRLVGSILCLVRRPRTSLRHRTLKLDSALHLVHRNRVGHKEATITHSRDGDVREWWQLNSVDLPPNNIPYAPCQ